MPEPAAGHPGVRPDDDADLWESTIALLETDGYDVVGVNDGRDAPELLRAGTVRPRLIILDLMMPGMDGWKFRAESAVRW